MEVIIIYYIFEYNILYSNFRYIDVDVSRKEVLFIEKMNNTKYIWTGGENMPGSDVDIWED